MCIILGATGHVGSAVAQSLLNQGKSVTIITHDAKKKAEWQPKGATVALSDVYDTDQLRSIFQQGKRLFVFNPPAPITTDTAQEEHRSIQSILAALRFSLTSNYSVCQIGYRIKKINSWTNFYSD